MVIQNSSYGTPRADLGKAIAELDFGADEFIARKVFPVLDLPKKAATLSVLTRENTKRPVTLARAAGDGFARLNLITEDLSYSCVNYAAESKLPDEDRWQYRSDFDAELAKAKMARRALLVEEEVRMSTIIQNTTTYTGSDLYVDHSSSYPWATSTTNVITSVDFAKQKVWSNTGMMPDTLVIDHTNLGYLLANTVIVARFPGMAAITEEALRANLAAIFGLKNLLVGSARYDSANEGTAYSGASCWSSTYAFVCKLAAGSPEEGGLGKTIRWSDGDEHIDSVYTYREEQTKSDIIRVEEYTDELMFDKYMGFLIKTA